MAITKKPEEVLRKAGRRSTRQRRLVLEALEREAGHLDAEAVYRRVKAQGERVSLATVYRSLAVLEGLGLVARDSLGEEHGHFEAVSGDKHFHFTCRSCGTVIEFQAPEAARSARRFAAARGCQVTDVHLSLSGLCARCRKTSNPRSRGKTAGRTVASPPGDRA